MFRPIKFIMLKWMDILKAFDESEGLYYFAGGSKIVISTVGAGYSLIAQLYEV